MRTMWIAAAVSAAVCGSAWLLGPPTSGQDGAPPGFTALEQRVLDLQDRISFLEGRQAPAQLKVSLPRPLDARELERRIAQLEQQLRETDSAPEPTEPDEKPQAPAPEEPTPPERSAEEHVRARRAEIARMPPEARPQALFDLAMAERKAGRHASEEELLLAVVEDAGRDSALGGEAAYQVGWARSSREDQEGAREAWLRSQAGFARGHWRQDYARYYAAEAAAKAGDPASARNEIEDLLRDVGDAPEKTTIRERSRQLLESLRR